MRRGYVGDGRPRRHESSQKHFTSNCTCQLSGQSSTEFASIPFASLYFLMKILSKSRHWGHGIKHTRSGDLLILTDVRSGNGDMRYY